MARKAKKRVVKKATKRKGPVILPKKMSSLIKIALRDVRKAEKQADKYFVDMGTYHEPREIVCTIEGSNEEISRRKTCVVCAAGAVMAFSLKASPDESLGTHNFGQNNDQLRAIDWLREGNVGDAAYLLDIRANINLYSLDTNIPDYDWQKPEPFHKAMEKLQAKLIKAGL